ncbi:hypothetical protein VPNG_05186 [Cytospora leucostoma]|uniref:Heterokaryon incompatibility domain-containing protein n=1 Tax=Cytospora leucostoma TaxID=1230097 RepID=A0A423X7G2_9PEZI|nr:hypothetical protein VPNG_05186 [Cytospora leucostoma]
MSHPDTSRPSDDKLDEGERTCEQPRGGLGKALSSYVYTPLPPEDVMVVDTCDTKTRGPKKLFTRLLVIHPGEYNDDIEVDLEVVALGDATLPFPTYDVLSYVWGANASPGIVHVGKEKRTIPITSNLDEAMRHLRHPDRPRHMWIDALCIDQANPKEQSRQVAYMSHIYWTAPRVVVWLGPSADDSDLALETLQDIGSRIRVDWLMERITGVTELDDERFGGDDSAHLPLSERQYRAVFALMQRSWFERIWIRQEVFKADEDESLAVCGSKAVSWGEFRRGLYCCVVNNAPRMFEGWMRQTWYARVYLIQPVIRQEPYDLASLRHSTVGALCTDPRDRIYALLGLLDNQYTNLSIIPDYSKAVEEVYQDVVLQYLRGSGSLDLLRSCGRDKDHNPTSLPTWVPDWSSPRHLPDPFRLPMVFCPFDACGEYLGGGILRVAGVSLGTIGDFFDLAVTSRKALVASIRSLLPRDAVDQAYPGGGNLQDAYRITLCVDYFCDRTEPPNYHEAETSSLSLSSRDSEEAMRSIMVEEDLPPENNFVNVVENSRYESRFFTTREGYLGWAPETAKRGDQIIQLLGCNLPIMVRRSSRPDGVYFEVIETCYLHGFMYGEAFLGRLPDGLQPVLHIGESDLPRFRDSKTGDTAIEDPRFSTLPIDLGRFRSERESGITPRLDIGPETWRSRGVEVVDFDLV